MLILISIYLSSGCIPLSEEAKITYLINRYYQAINQQDWNKAKNYCIDNSSAYNEVAVIEGNVAQWDSSLVDISLDYSFFVYEIAISGQFATVEGFLSFQVEVEDSIVVDESGNKSINLEKIGDNWKLD